jgi:hypothetical protein
MKKSIKILSIVLCLGMIAAACAVLFVGCKSEPASQDATFRLEVRRFNGTDSLGVTKLDGELLASKDIAVKAGQVHVSEALAAAATNENGLNKISFSSSDYLLFSGDSWFISGGHFDAETAYIDADFQYSYCAYNGSMSNGATSDPVDGLTVYTIVIDGWDGEIGGTKPYVG